MTTGLGVQSIAKHVEELEREGIVRMNGVLPSGRCKVWRKAMDRTLENALAAISSGTLPFGDRFGAVHARGEGHRHDVFLPLASPNGDENEQELANMIQSVVHFVKPVIEGVLLEEGAGSRSEQPVLHDCSCVISEPGASAQPVHPDVLCNGNEQKCKLVQIFVALDDISSDMGPTKLWPGTHIPSFQHKFTQAAMMYGSAVTEQMMYGKSSPKVIVRVLDWH
jgi:hypothetical protein